PAWRVTTTLRGLPRLLTSPPRAPGSPRFPYTTLFRSVLALADAFAVVAVPGAGFLDDLVVGAEVEDFAFARSAFSVQDVEEGTSDRKSTRLNSSHVKISYAVFCLKKKRPATSHGPGQT